MSEFRPELTEEEEQHIRSFKFFHIEKGDAERYVEYKIAWETIQKKRPLLATAFNNFKQAEFLLEKVLEEF